MESGPDPSDTDTDTPPPVCFTTVTSSSPTTHSESLSSDFSENLRFPQPDIEREKEVENHREGYVLDENIEFEDEGYGGDCDMILQQQQQLSQESQKQMQQLKDYYETKAAQEAKKMSELEAQLKEAMQRYTEAEAQIERLESLLSEEVRAREKIKLLEDKVSRQDRLRSPSPGMARSSYSTPDQVTSSSSTRDMARSSLSSPNNSPSPSSQDQTASLSSPDMVRSSSSSPDQVMASSSRQDMASPSPSSPDSERLASSSSPEIEARPVTSDHSYAQSGLSTESSPKIPPELISLKVPKKLEDRSLPSIEDVLRHCVYIRTGSRSKLSAADIARQATVDIVEVWQKLSSKFSRQVIMRKGNIQKKIVTLLGRYKQLIKKSTGVINRSKLQEMTTEVRKFFDILSCKK